MSAGQADAGAVTGTIGLTRAAAALPAQTQNRREPAQGAAGIARRAQNPAKQGQPFAGSSRATAVCVPQAGASGSSIR